MSASGEEKMGWMDPSGRCDTEGSDISERLSMSNSGGVEVAMTFSTRKFVSPLRYAKWG